MITEDYVSFETAKLLKEKGFEGENRDWYNMEGFIEEVGVDDGIDPTAHEDIFNSIIPAPTLQMAMKWLREVHHLFIAIHPRLSFTDSYWITADIYKVKRKSSLYHIEDVDDYYCVAICDETSFEKACEAAIKYCLEHLI